LTPLVLILKNEEGNIRRYATLALKDIKSDKVIGQLVETLNDDDWSVRKFASNGFGRNREQYCSRPALINTLTDEDWV